MQQATNVPYRHILEIEFVFLGQRTSKIVSLLKYKYPGEYIQVDSFIMHLDILLVPEATIRVRDVTPQAQRMYSSTGRETVNVGADT